VHQQVRGGGTGDTVYVSGRGIVKKEINFTSDINPPHSVPPPLDEKGACCEGMGLHFMIEVRIAL